MSEVYCRVVLAPYYTHIEDKYLHEALVRTSRALMGHMRDEARVIPRDVGTLQGPKFTTDFSYLESHNFVRLMFSGPYARRLYYHPEYNFSKKENPNAQGLWFRPYMKGGIHHNYIVETFERELLVVMSK